MNGCSVMLYALKRYVTNIVYRFAQTKEIVYTVRNKTNAHTHTNKDTDTHPHTHTHCTNEFDVKGIGFTEMNKTRFIICTQYTA